LVWFGVKGVEFGADLVGGGVAEVVEDGQGLSPGIVGGLGIAGGEAGLAEAGEGVGFLVAVAEILEQVQGMLVTGEGLVVVPEVVVGVAEAVPRVRLPISVVEFLVQGEGLLAVDEGARLVAAWSYQWPRRSRKIRRVRASCQAWMSKPVTAAWSMAARSTGCSMVNQSSAWW
jgi:hypothetical protein